MQTTKPEIVIVDDDEQILSSLKVALSHLYTVTVCSSAVQGLDQIQKVRPAAVIIDIKMPGHDGFWLFSKIRQLNPTLPIIFNSAFQDVMPAGDVHNTMGPFAMLPKTGKLRDVIATIGAAVRQSAQASA